MITFNKLGKMGRLGNQMFQIASTIGIAKKYGYEYGFNWNNSLFINKLPEIKEKVSKEVSINWGYNDFNPGDNCSLKGYLQSEKYFNHCSNLIKYYFTIKVDTVLPDKFTAIHLRGKDYIKNECHDVLDWSYWDAALSMISNPVIIFTDDYEYASKIFNNKFEVRSNINSVIDLYSISQADEIIMSNSSFSWWGAWLSNADKIIIPKNWFGGRKQNLDVTDIYCEKWKIV